MNLRGCLRISNVNLVRFDMTTNDEDGLSAGPVPTIDPVNPGDDPPVPDPIIDAMDTIVDPVTPGLEPSLSGDPMPEPGEEPVAVVTAPPPPELTDVTDPPVEGGGDGGGGGGGGKDDPDPGE
jgi:hypothetical protein